MSAKPFLLLQSRPETEASDDEFRAFCRMGGLDESQVVRVRMDKGEFPDIDLAEYSGVLMGGGPANLAYSEDEKSEMQKAFEPWLFNLLGRIVAEDKPFLGVCLGLGALMKLLGGEVSLDYPEPLAAMEVTLTNAGRQDDLLAGMPMSFAAFAGHKEGVGTVPAGAVELARSSVCSQMVRVGRNVYVTQFHPELDAGGLVLRIGVYKNAGYFHPDEMDDLIAAAWQAEVNEPVKILRRFVERYSVDAAD